MVKIHETSYKVGLVLLFVGFGPLAEPTPKASELPSIAHPMQKQRQPLKRQPKRDVWRENVLPKPAVKEASSGDPVLGESKRAPKNRSYEMGGRGKKKSYFSEVSAVRTVWDGIRDSLGRSETAFFFAQAYAHVWRQKAGLNRYWGRR